MTKPWDLLPRLSADDFKPPRLDRKGLWAVCFGADWCPYCRAFLPLFAALNERAASEGFHLAMGDLADHDDPLWETFDIEVVPSLLAFRDGELIWRRDGAPGVGLEERDLQALCYELIGAPCSPTDREAGLRFGSRRPRRG